jgi:hypothetical protein
MTPDEQVPRPLSPEQVKAAAALDLEIRRVERLLADAGPGTKRAAQYRNSLGQLLSERDAIAHPKPFPPPEQQA